MIGAVRHDHRGPPHNEPQTDDIELVGPTKRLHRSGEQLPDQRRSADHNHLHRASTQTTDRPKVGVDLVERNRRIAEQRPDEPDVLTPLRPWDRPHIKMTPSQPSRLSRIGIPG